MSSTDRAEPFRRISVDLPDGRTIPVVIGPEATGELAGLLPRSATRVAVVTQSGIGVEVDPGVPHEVFHIGDGEAHKRLSTVEHLCSEFARFGLTRADCVVGVGGGLVTDVSGLAASLYHRGIPVIHVATTLLAQIDAAIGGKTGVNLPEGKNLVGTFWQPTAVLCDTDTLSSLPPREWRCGLGELAKYHWLGGGRLDELGLVDRIARCVEIKAAFVAADEGLHQGVERAKARAVDDGGCAQHRIDEEGRVGPVPALVLLFDGAVGRAGELVAALAPELLGIGHIGARRVRAGGTGGCQRQRGAGQDTCGRTGSAGRTIRHHAPPRQTPSVAEIGSACGAAGMPASVTRAWG